jgi:glyceraldehyde-3-phosphate dehydrogenase type I
VVDATGVYKTHEKASQHTAAGAGAVVITSPVKDEAIPTIVRGVNDTDALLEQAALQRVVAVSSCSTNCIAPILKLFSDHVAIESASAQVVHARTNSQPHLDGRGNATSDRRSADNIVVASTGSATEVQRLLPRLPFYSNSIRVPVPDGSLAMINMEIAGKITDANVVGLLVEASKDDTVIGVTEHNMFSARIVGKPRSSVIDLNRVRVTPHADRTSVELQAWFDNEWGYSARVLEVATRIGQLVRG